MSHLPTDKEWCLQHKKLLNDKKCKMHIMILYEKCSYISRFC
jgi:hypothetical protein